MTESRCFIVAHPHQVSQWPLRLAYTQCRDTSWRAQEFVFARPVADGVHFAPEAACAISYNLDMDLEVGTHVEC